MDWWVVPIAGGSAVSTGALDALRRAGYKVRGDDVEMPTPDAWLDDSIIFSGQIGNARNLWRLRISSTTWKVICIWAQRLDPPTKRPVGPPLELYHSHSARRSLLNAEIIPLELHVAPGRLLFHLGEITGNIWMVEWKTR